MNDSSTNVTRYSTRKCPPLSIKDRPSERFVQAIFSRFRGLVEAHAFARHCPRTCVDKNEVVDTDTDNLLHELLGEIPLLPDFNSFEAFIEFTKKDDEEALAVKSSIIWDVIEFAYEYGCDASNSSYHEHFGHHHLSFDKSKFQREFRTFVKRLLRTHGLAYVLTESGQIDRHVSSMEQVALDEIDQNWWKDDQVNRFLHSSRRHFLSRDPNDIELALNELWDAFERVKTLETEGDKKSSANKMVTRMAHGSDLTEELKIEAEQLTKIGNKYGIRHSEHNQKFNRTTEHARYLYFRMLAFLRLAARDL